MSKHYAGIAFTDPVRTVQAEHGSADFYGAKADQARALPGTDQLTGREIDYLAQQDGFYMATVSETGWPYVQYRGGPQGFLRVLDPATIGWADFRGNLQYVSTGNLATNDRVALIVLDYRRQQRLKIYGRARIVRTEDDPELVAQLNDPSYDAIVERGVLITVDAFDWNCPQHITPRYTAHEVETAVEPLRARLAELEAENASLRGQL
jgi:uncharacterized protein